MTILIVKPSHLNFRGLIDHARLCLANAIHIHEMLVSRATTKLPSNQYPSIDEQDSWMVLRIFNLFSETVAFAALVVDKWLKARN